MLYLRYYSLNEEPFQDSTDPKFFWLGEGQSEAIAILTYGIEKGDSITLLTGDVGTGKTAIVKYLAGILKKEFIIAKIDDSDIESSHFFYFLADSLNLPNSFEDKGAIFKYIDNEYTKTKKRMLIIVDEAHRATKSLLSDLDLMAKIKRDQKQLINIVLVGQNSLMKLIKDKPINDGMQKMPILCNLRSLTIKETIEYINHRLRVAGTDKKLFSMGAIGKIFKYSNGIPRLINSLCDHALMIGYSTELEEISPLVIKECVEDLQIGNKVNDNGKKLIRDLSGENILKQTYQRAKHKLNSLTS